MLCLEAISLAVELYQISFLCPSDTLRPTIKVRAEAVSGTSAFSINFGKPPPHDLQKLRTVSAIQSSLASRLTLQPTFHQAKDALYHLPASEIGQLGLGCLAMVKMKRFESMVERKVQSMDKFPRTRWLSLSMTTVLSAITQAVHSLRSATDRCNLLAKTFQSTVGKATDHNFGETTSFVSKLSKTSETNPDGIVRLTQKLQNVDPPVKEEFCILAEAVNEKLTLAKRAYLQRAAMTPVVNTSAPARQPAAPRPIAPASASGMRR